MLLLLVVTVCGSSIGVESLPLPDSGPHLANDWGEAVRLRHLYAARHGLHLQINPDGEISGSYMQSSDSKWRACHAVTLISALHVGSGSMTNKDVRADKEGQSCEIQFKTRVDFWEVNFWNVFICIKHIGYTTNMASGVTSSKKARGCTIEWLRSFWFMVFVLKRLIILYIVFR